MTRKDDEMRQLREYITEQEKRKKKGMPKELLKAKKQLKDRERECLRLQNKLMAVRQQIEEGGSN